MNNFRKLLTVIFFNIGILFCFTQQVLAQGDSVRKKFYVGMDTGIGLLKLSRNDLSTRNTCFALGFNAGVIPFEWLRTGINLNGWLLESYGNFYVDPAKGKSISNFFGEIEVFPFKKADLFVKLSGGFSKYISMHIDEFDAKGLGARFGVGYERRLYRKINVSLMMNYGFGRFNDVKNVIASIDNQHYRITEFVIGFVYR